GFEIPQFEIKALVNVADVDDVKSWFAAFEEHSKSTIPQTKEYNVKEKQ
ncbi:31885_t:CDS:1, partial [Racocetra persica]